MSNTGVNFNMFRGVWNMQEKSFRSEIYGQIYNEYLVMINITSACACNYLPVTVDLNRWKFLQSFRWQVIVNIKPSLRIFIKQENSWNEFVQTLHIRTKITVKLYVRKWSTPTLPFLNIVYRWKFSGENFWKCLSTFSTFFRTYRSSSLK